MGEEKAMTDEVETVEKTSPDLLAEQTEQLKHIFPQVFSEGKIDFDKLRTALGDIVDNQPERYSFTWAGKRSATQLLQTPSHATLVPVEGESVSFDTTQNLFIEGDNLEVLKLLYKSFSGLVKMIYIDPPYNTGNDFVYPDNFADPLETYLEITGQKDAKGNLLTSNPETSGRYHSAWLSMMYPRLYLARQLLRDDGIIFISIDDNEDANLRKLMDEIFGEENFVAQIIWIKKYASANDVKNFSENHDYILVYRKTDKFERNLLPRSEKQDKLYKYDDNDGKGKWRSDNLSVRTYSQNYDFPITNPNTGNIYNPPKGRSWLTNQETVQKWITEGRIFFGKDGKGAPQLKRYLFEVQQGIVPNTVWSYEEVGHNDESRKEIKDIFGTSSYFETPKPVRLMKRILQISTSEDDIILDFFAGSGTTAQAVLELNREDDGDRQFIMVQLPEKTNFEEFPSIAEVGKERIRRVIAKMRSEVEGKLDLSTRKKPEDLGFRVFKLAPSNYKQWYSTDSADVEAYTRHLAAFTEPLVEGWSPEQVIWEVAIKEGYGLNANIKHLEEIRDNTVWQVTNPDKGQSFFICLDNTLQPATLSTLPLTKDHIFVCLNKALDDTLAANLALQCRLKKI